MTGLTLLLGFPSQPFWPQGSEVVFLKCWKQRGEGMPGQRVTLVQCRLRGAIRSRHSGTVHLCVCLLNCSIPVPGARLCCAVLPGPWVTVWRSGLAWCILALYIVVLFIPYSLAGAAGQGLAAGRFHPQLLLCLWLQPALSRPLRALLTLSKTKAIHTAVEQRGEPQCCAPALPCCLPRPRWALEGWWLPRGPASVGPGLPLIWQQ